MPTPIFVCGAECGITAGGTTAAMAGTAQNGHWQTMDSLITVDTAFFAPGGSTRSYKVAPVTTAKQLARTFVAAGNFVAARFKLMWTTTPSAATLVAWADGGTSLMGIRYNGGNLELYQKSLGTIAIGPAVVVNKWYTIDLLVDTSANPWLGSWRVDGVAYGGISSAVATATRTGFIFGNDLSATQTMYIDDIVISQTTADYPFGPGAVISGIPTSDGTHSFTLGDFKYEHSSNVAVAATDVYTHLDDVLDNVTDYISQDVINASGYVDVEIGDLPATVRMINGVEVVSSYHASAATACTCSLRIEDGATESAVFALLSPGATTLVNYSKQYATSAATGLSWTPTQIGNLHARFGYSGDVTPFPFIDGIRLEVDVNQANAIRFNNYQAVDVGDGESSSGKIR